MINGRPFSVVAISLLIVAFLNFPQCFSFDWYSTCSRNFTCGELDVGFPFLGNGRDQHCGHPKLELYCRHNTSYIDIMDVSYYVYSVDEETQILSLGRADFNFVCDDQPPIYGNSALDYEIFEYAPGYGEFTLLYKCSDKSIAANLTDYCGDRSVMSYVTRSRSVRGDESCSSKLTVLGDLSIFNETKMLSTYVKVRYKVGDDESCSKCRRSGGVCGYYAARNQMTCYCRDYSSHLTPAECPPYNATDSGSIPKSTDSGQSVAAPQVLEKGTKSFILFFWKILVVHFLGIRSNRFILTFFFFSLLSGLLFWLN